MYIVSNFSDYYDKIQQYGVDKNVTLVRICKHPFKFDKTNEWQMSAIENNVEDAKLSDKFTRSDLPFPETSEVDKKIINVFNSCFRATLERGVSSTGAIDLEAVVAVINGNLFKSYVILERHDNPLNSLYSIHNPYHIVKKNASFEEIYNFLKSKKDVITPKLTRYRYDHDGQLLFNSKNYEEFVQTVRDQKDTSGWHYKSKHSSIKTLTKDELLEMHKVLESPIYFIQGNKVFANVPLSYFGFNQVFDGNVEQLYQEIEYCLMNVIKNKNEPPLAISDLDKVVQHGFDKKVSFRKRT